MNTKRVIPLLTGLLAVVSLLAQSPHAFQYQAVLRESDGSLISEQDVELQIDLVQGTTDGTVVYSETHQIRTNILGLVTVAIGNGNTTDVFSSIDWGDHSHFIKVWLNGVEMGTTQLLSVPYAIYTETSGHARTFDVLLEKGETPCTAETKGAMRYNDSTDRVEFCNGSNWIALSGGLSVELARLTTRPVMEISTSSAISGGTILSNGGAEIFEKGICWNTTGAPDVSDTKSNDGSGSENYVSSMGPLTSNEVYFVRAYARNTMGTAYGDERSFTTLVNVTETKNAEYINSTTFSSGGIHEAGGSGTITERGIVYGTVENPTKADQYAVSLDETGDFMVTVVDLEDNTYHFRAYAINETGINYGPEKTYRNHYVTESSIRIMPSSVQFSRVYGDSFSPPAATSPDNGKTNTEALIAYWGTDATAAYICDTLTANGFTDWFLPSKEELNHVYLNKNTIGIAEPNAYFWSSTMHSFEEGWVQHFGNGGQEFQDLLVTNRMICIRRKD